MPATTGRHHHQNSFGFRHNKHSKLTEKIASLPEYNVCQRCSDIIEWRKKYRKYKVQKDATRCVYCHQRKVKLAYHSACDECCSQRAVCAKCLHSTQQVGQLVEQQQKKLTGDELALMIESAAVSERYRRKCRRLYEKGEKDADQIVEMLANYGMRREQAEQVEDEDELDFDSDSDSDEDSSHFSSEAAAVSGGSAAVSATDLETEDMSKLVKRVHIDATQDQATHRCDTCDSDANSAVVAVAPAGNEQCSAG